MSESFPQSQSCEIKETDKELHFPGEFALGFQLNPSSEGGPITFIIGK